MKSVKERKHITTTNAISKKKHNKEIRTKERKQKKGTLHHVARTERLIYYFVLPLALLCKEFTAAWDGLSLGRTGVAAAWACTVQQIDLAPVW